MSQTVFIDLPNTPITRAEVNKTICRYCEVGHEQNWFSESGRGQIILERTRCSRGKTLRGLIAALNRIANVTAHKAETVTEVSGGDDVHAPCAAAE